MPDPQNIGVLPERCHVFIPNSPKKSDMIATMSTYDSIFKDILASEGIMTPEVALKTVYDDAIAFYWAEDRQEDHQLLHQVHLLSDLCMMLYEVFAYHRDEEVEVPDDLDLDLIQGIIPVVGLIYGHLPEGNYVHRCVKALREVQGEQTTPRALLDVLPLAAGD